MENRTPQRVVMIIWGALVMAVVVYWGLASGSEPSEVKPDDSLAQTLAWVAAGVSGASLMLRQLLLGDFQSGKISLKTEAGRVRFLTGNIVCFALAESVALFGLVLAFTGHPQSDWLVFFAAAVLLLIIHIPLPGRFQPKARL